MNLDLYLHVHISTIWLHIIVCANFIHLVITADQLMLVVALHGYECSIVLISSSCWFLYALLFEAATQGLSEWSALFVTHW